MKPFNPALRQRSLEFDYLRGMSIALIVLGHSIFLSHLHFPVLLKSMLLGGTGVFVFISGFFFHRVFYSRFNYIQFINKKARVLLIPFATISFFALAIRMLGWWQDGLNWQESFLSAWSTLRNGYILYPHWYIPFIFLTFLLSPLHIIYIEMGFSKRIFIIVIFILIALLIHRPEGNNNFFQALVYFTPYYLLGILFSQYEHWWSRWHQLLFVLSAVAVVVTSFVHTYIWVNVGNYHKAAFVYAGIDLQFIQILFMCIAMLTFCCHIHWPWLQRHLCWLGELSFPIFFIHPLLTIALENLVAIEMIKPFFPVSGLGTSLLVFIVVFLVQFYGSVGIAVLVRMIAKKNSRFIVG